MGLINEDFSLPSIPEIRTMIFLQFFIFFTIRVFAVTSESTSEDDYNFFKTFFFIASLVFLAIILLLILVGAGAYIYLRRTSKDDDQNRDAFQKENTGLSDEKQVCTILMI